MIRASLFAAALLGAADAWSLGIGTASLDSSLGEPLRVSLPITLQPDDDVGCIQVRARGDDLPSVFNTRSNVVRVGSQTRVEISSAQPVVEPTVGLVVTIGCTSPVSREFVLFLDPPIVAPRAAIGDETPRSVVEPTVPRRLGRPGPRRAESGTVPTPRRTPRANRAPDASATTAPVRKPSAPRPAPVLPAAPTSIIVEPAAPPATKSPTSPPPAAQTPAPAPSTGNRDRLSIAPQLPAGQAPTAAAGTTPTSSGSGATTTPTAADGTPLAVAAANATADQELMAREQALRTQRDALQARISTLSDQIAALRAQTTALTTRNQALEESTISPIWFWLLALLALIALIAAAWMARSYLSLKRSVESSDWWAATQASNMATGTDDDDMRDDLAALDAGTRMSSGIARPMTKTDVRTSHVAPPPAVVSNVERSRPMARTQTNNYPPAIETDFTVSDIEVAMATVRTVSPPRPPQPNLSDSDLGHLGGPTEPLAYTDPPPASAAAPSPATPRGPFASDVTGDVNASMPDLNVPPMDVAGSQPRPIVSAPEPEAPAMDFKLEIPESYDPLESDAFKQTEFDRTNPTRTTEFDPSRAAPPQSGVDFEIPTAIVPEGDDARHGATALNNLFASTETDNPKLGVDTILNLDDRNDSPLSASDVGRFTSTAIDNPSGTSQATVQGRMSRFADLMNQVDEAAVADPLRAIAMLRQYVLKDENIPTILWLRLFELYKAVDKRQVYDALAEHFHRRYNRPMVGWGEKLSDRVPQTPLSAFKELDSQIEASWGMEIGLDRLQTLLCGHDQSDAIVFNAVLQRDLLDAAKIFLLDRDSSIAPKN